MLHQTSEPVEKFVRLTKKDQRGYHKPIRHSLLGHNEIIPHNFRRFGRQTYQFDLFWKILDQCRQKKLKRSSKPS